jgi:hypothetical protein
MLFFWLFTKISFLQDKDELLAWMIGEVKLILGFSGKKWATSGPECN